MAAEERLRDFRKPWLLATYAFFFLAEKSLRGSQAEVSGEPVDAEESVAGKETE